MSQFIRIKEMPTNERPRERFLALGPDALTTAELLAILLRTGLKGANAVQIGAQLLKKYGSLNALAGAAHQDLQSVAGVGRDKAVTLAAAFAIARKLVAELRHELPVLDTPEAVAALMREDVRFRTVEAFFVFLVNTRRRLIEIAKVADGTLDTLLIHPREVFRPAILAAASGIILAHNHPSGDPYPSDADVRVTRDLIRAGHLLRIDVLDHVILGQRSAERAQDFVSLKELGMLG